MTIADYKNPQISIILECLKQNGDLSAADIEQKVQLSKAYVAKLLNHLVDTRRIVRMEDPARKYSLYNLADLKESILPVASSRVVNTSIHALPPSSTSFISINPAIGWDRVVLLKKLKKKLIEEHHYLLDMVIADYERILRFNDEGDDM